jgi:hypothetical protein
VHCARGAQHVHQLLGFHHRHEPDVCTKRQDCGLATRIWKERRKTLSKLSVPKGLFRAPNVVGHKRVRIFRANFNLIHCKPKIPKPF